MWLSRASTRSFAPPDWLTVNLTLRCNLACTMCTTCYDAPELSTRELLDLVDQAAAMGVKVFNPLGGEPFVRTDLEDILAHAARRDLYTTLTTNGTLVTRPRADRLAQIPVEKLHLNVSLDGLEAAHDRVRGAGSFAKAQAGYRKLREADAAAGNPLRKICANVILHRRNLAEFPALLDWLADEGFSGVQVLHLFRTGSDPTVGGMWFEEADLPALERLVEGLAAGEAPLPVLNRPADLRLVPRYYREGLGPLEAPCWAGWKELYVNADGGAIMCDGKLDFLAGRYGSVRESTLRELWSSPALRARREVVKTCTTPCVQSCYLRRDSDALGPLAERAGRELGARVRRRLGRRAPRRRVAEVLTLELCDVPSTLGDRRLARFFARSPVAPEAVWAEPARYEALRRTRALDFGRGFAGEELVERVLAGLDVAGLGFGAVRLDWRGDWRWHPSLPSVLGRLADAVAAGALERVELADDGRWWPAGIDPLLAAKPGVFVRVPAGEAPGPAVSWDARLVADRGDTRLLRVVGNVAEEDVGEVLRRL